MNIRTFYKRLSSGSFPDTINNCIEKDLKPKHNHVLISNMLQGGVTNYLLNTVFQSSLLYVYLQNHKA